MFTTFLKKPQKTTYYEAETPGSWTQNKESSQLNRALDNIVFIEDFEKLTTLQFLKYLGKYRDYINNKKQLDPVSAFEVRRIYDYLITPHGEKRAQNYLGYYDKYSFSSALSDYYYSEFMSTMDNVFRGAPESSREYAEIMRRLYVELKNDDIPPVHPKEIDALRAKYPDMIMNTKVDGILGPNVVTVLSHS